jgi:hypothetical protein
MTLDNAVLYDNTDQEASLIEEVAQQDMNMDSTQEDTSSISQDPGAQDTIVNCTDPRTLDQYMIPQEDMDETNVTDVFLKIKPEHMFNICARIKNHEFRKYPLPPNTTRIWFYEINPIDALTYVVTVGGVRYPGEVQDSVGLGNDDFDAGLKDSKFGYPIQKVSFLQRPLSSAQLLEEHNLEIPNHYYALPPSVLDTVPDSSLTVLFDTAGSAQWLSDPTTTIDYDATALHDTSTNHWSEEGQTLQPLTYIYQACIDSDYSPHSPLPGPTEEYRQAERADNMDFYHNNRFISIMRGNRPVYMYQDHSDNTDNEPAHSRNMHTRRRPLNPYLSDESHNWSDSNMEEDSSESESHSIMIRHKDPLHHSISHPLQKNP